MINVLICDDSGKQVVWLQQMIQKYQTQRRHSLFHVFAYVTSKDALRRISSNQIEIAILDIEIDEKTGIDVAKELRACNPDCMIIFITNYDSFAYSAYEIEAFSYLLKPVEETKLFRQFDKILSIYRKERILKRYILPKLEVRTKGKTIYIQQEEILYIEKSGKNVIIVTEDTSYEYRENLKELEAKLNKESFLRCHSGFIVNVNRITSYKRSAVYLGKSEITIPVSKANVIKVTDCLEKRLWENVV